jgi:hypothetical protein
MAGAAQKGERVCAQGFVFQREPFGITALVETRDLRDDSALAGGGALVLHAAANRGR